MRDVYYGRLATGGRVKLVRLSKNQREAQKLWAEWLAKNQKPFHPVREVEVAKHELEDAWGELEVFYRARNTAESVIDDYRRHFRGFQKWLAKNGKTTLEEVKTADVVSYLAEETRGKSNCLKRNFLYMARKLFAVNLPNGDNPAKQVKVEWQEQTARKPLTDDELEAIIAEARKRDFGNELAGLITVGLYTGLRRKDCVYLNSSNIHDGLIEATPFKTKKKGIKVYIPIHPNLQAVLDSLVPGRDGSLFPNLKLEYEAKRLDGKIGRVFRKVVQVSIAVDGRNRKIPYKSFHSLRSTFITRLAEANVNLAVIRSMSGHSNFQQLLRYCHPNNESKTRAIETLNFGIR